MCHDKDSVYDVQDIALPRRVIACPVCAIITSASLVQWCTLSLAYKTSLWIYIMHSPILPVGVALNEYRSYYYA